MSGPAIYTGSIEYYSFYTIGVNAYCVIFHADGTATQLNTTTSAQTTITPNLPFFTSSGLLPCAKQWGTQYLLISNRNTTMTIGRGTARCSMGRGPSPEQRHASLRWVRLRDRADLHGVRRLRVRGRADAGGLGWPSRRTHHHQPRNRLPAGRRRAGRVQRRRGRHDADLTAQLYAGGVGGAIITAGGTGYTSPTVAFSGWWDRRRGDRA